MGDFVASDEVREFVCPEQRIPQGPAILLGGLHRATIRFTSNEGHLYQRESMAEIR